MTVVRNFHEPILFQCSHITEGKVSLFGVFSTPYFPVFVQNTEIYSEYLRIPSECGKTRTRKKSGFDNFSRSVYFITFSILECFRVLESIKINGNIATKWVKRSGFSDPAELEDQIFS